VWCGEFDDLKKKTIYKQQPVNSKQQTTYRSSEINGKIKCN